MPIVLVMLEGEDNYVRLRNEGVDLLSVEARKEVVVADTVEARMRTEASHDNIGGFRASAAEG